MKMTELLAVRTEQEFAELASQLIDKTQLWLLDANWWENPDREAPSWPEDYSLVATYEVSTSSLDEAFRLGHQLEHLALSEPSKVHFFAPFGREEIGGGICTLSIPRPPMAGDVFIQADGTTFLVDWVGFAKLSCSSTHWLAWNKVLRAAVH